MQTRHKYKQRVDSSVIIQFFQTNWFIAAYRHFVKPPLILQFIKTFLTLLKCKTLKPVMTQELQNPKHSYAVTIGIFSQADAEKLVSNVCLLGFAIGCYIFIIFSPKLINILRQREDKLMSKAQALLLLLVQIFPHVIAVLLLGEIAPQWKTMPAMFLLIVLTQLIAVIPTFRLIGRIGNWQSILKVAGNAMGLESRTSYY